MALKIQPGGIFCHQDYKFKNWKLYRGLLTFNKGFLWKDCFYGKIRDPDDENTPGRIFKANEPVLNLQKNRLAEPQDITIAIFIMKFEILIPKTSQEVFYGQWK